MSIRRLDHTAIAVRDLEAAIFAYVSMFPGAAIERTSVPDQQVDVAFLRFGDTAVELIQPTSPDSGVARFLERRGEGLHHIAFAVDDLQAELDQLSTSGVELINREPRPGAHGRVAFIHPRSAVVLIELVQHEP